MVNKIKTSAPPPSLPAETAAALMPPPPPGIMMHKRAEVSKDRISNLPDCIREKILSCLPIRDAARTSILSTEWKQSWTCSTNLDFGRSQKPPHLRPLGGFFHTGVEGESESFISFVNRVLQLRGRPYIRRFSMIDYVILSQWPDSKSPMINDWLSAVVRCNIEEMVFSIELNSQIVLDPSIFLCTTLVILKLKIEGDVDIPSRVWLPRLRTLHLKDAKFQDEKSINRLISGCPVLEELKLRDCFGYKVHTVNIRAPALTSLIIEHFGGPGSEFNSVDYINVLVDAPALKYINIKDKLPGTYELKNLPNLMEAVIDIGPYDEEEFDDDAEYYREGHSKAITSLLSGVSHVQLLVLSWKLLQFIQWCEPILPTFCNLTYMEVGTSCHIGWDLLPKLLQISPRLETLYLKQRATRFKDPRQYSSFHDVTTCLPSHLKGIQIENFRGREDEMHMVEYFLLNAKFLEKLIIAHQSPSEYNENQSPSETSDNESPSENTEDEPPSENTGDQLPSENTEKCSKLLEKLQLLPRCSATCRFEVS